VVTTAHGVTPATAAVATLCLVRAQWIRAAVKPQGPTAPNRRPASGSAEEETASWFEECVK